MIFILIITIITLLSLFYFLLKARNIDIWLFDYILHHYRLRKINIDKPIHILFCFVDHYEPQWKNNDIELERKRVDRWINDYPKLVSNHKDSDGHYPIHSFFYPIEEYREEHLNKLQSLCSKGMGELEIHLHHDNDTEENFINDISGFKKTLYDVHNGLSHDPDGNVGFAFIHGNWTLDNSHPDGRYCGLNNEISLLKDLNCYVDMTLPSAPSPTQTKKVNSIYMAVDDPLKSKSHNTGLDVVYGEGIKGDLMMIPGPLCFNWSNRKFGIIPKIENSDIRKHQPPDKHRVDLWVKQHIHVKNKPEWVFIKIHTHGAQDDDMDCLLGDEVDEMHSYLEDKYNNGSDYVLHYVSAREMYNIARAAADGKDGNPNEFRDYYYKKKNH